MALLASELEEEEGGAEGTFVLLRERDDALDLGCALEDGDGLLGGVGEDERPGGGGGGTPWAGDEAERVERACGGSRGGEECGGRREEEGLRGHGGGGGGLWEFGRVSLGCGVGVTGGRR